MPEEEGALRASSPEPAFLESPEGKKMAQDNDEAGGVDDWAAAMAEQDVTPEEGTSQVNFANLGASGSPHADSKNLDFLLDIPLEVKVELGRSTVVINKLLQLNQGSIVELEKAAGEPVEIFVNDKLLGKGEVVVVNERFGVRITEIISQADRIKNMS